MIRCLEVRGTRYEMGAAIGKEFSAHLKKRTAEYAEALAAPEAQAFLAAVKPAIRAASEGCWEELRGRADGAGVDFDALLLLMSPEYFARVDGCTTVYVKDGRGKVKFSHNEDNTGYTDDTVALVKYVSGDRWVVSYTMAERLAGCAFSWNSSGMIFSTNYIVPDTHDLRNPSRYFLIRDIIESTSMAEALDRVTRFPTASPFSLNVVDTKADRAVNCEKDVSTVYVRELRDRYARANHFILKQGSIRTTDSSVFRQEKITELVGKLDLENVTSHDLVEALSYREPDIGRCIYKDFSTFFPAGKSTTVANFAYDNATGLLTVRDYITGDAVTWTWNGFTPHRAD